MSAGSRRAPLGIVDLGTLERACKAGWGQRPLGDLVRGPLPELEGEPSLDQASQAAAAGGAGGVWLRGAPGWLGPQEAGLAPGTVSPKARPLRAWLSDLPAGLRDAARFLARTFPDRQPCLVGGPVRDLLLGIEVRDLDVCLRGPVRPVAERLAASVGAGVEFHASFDTASVTLAGGLRVDLTGWRAETYPRPGALPHCRPGGLWDDLFRRDFTVHALALALSGPWVGSVLDAHGGVPDLLERRRLRILHALSFLDDPTRIFRAARYAGRLRLRIERGTLAALRAAVETGALDRLSAARLRREWALLLCEPAAGAAVVLLGRWGVLEALVPGWSPPPGIHRSLRALLGTTQANTGNGSRPLFLTGLGLLLASVSPAGRAAFARRLGLAARDRRWLEEAPDAARLLAGAASETPSPGSLHRVGWRLDDETVRLAAALADSSGTARRLRRYLDLRRRARNVVRGEHLLRAGVAGGRGFGALLEAARATWMDRPRSSAETATMLALRDPAGLVDTWPAPV